MKEESRDKISRETERSVQLEAELLQKQEEIKSLEDAKEALSKQVELLENSNSSSASAQAAALEERRMEIEELKGRIETMEQQHESFRQDTRTRMVSAVEKIKKTNEELRAKVAEIEKLQEQSASLEKQNEELSQKCVDKSNELTMVKEAYTRQQREVDEHSYRVQELEELRKSHEAKVNEQSQQLSTMQNDLITKDTLLLSSTEHIQHLENTTKELQETIQQLLSQQKQSRIVHPLKWNEFEVILRCADQDEVNWCLIR